MRNFLKIERIPYEEPYHLELHWAVSSEEGAAHFEFYDNAEILTSFAQGLVNFPKHVKDKFAYQLGSEKPEDNFAYFFNFEVALTNGRGHDAGIDIRFTNNRKSSDLRVIDFRLSTSAPRIRKLGESFQEFSKLKSEILYWDNVSEFVGSVEDFDLGIRMRSHA